MQPTCTNKVDILINYSNMISIINRMLKKYITIKKVYNNASTVLFLSMARWEPLHNTKVCNMSCLFLYNVCTTNILHFCKHGRFNYGHTYINVIKSVLIFLHLMLCSHYANQPPHNVSHPDVLLVWNHYLVSCGHLQPFQQSVGLQQLLDLYTFGSHHRQQMGHSHGVSLKSSVFHLHRFHFQKSPRGNSKRFKYYSE